jgi:ABC-type branched-subunit amino acid transport system ATPase component
MTAVVEQYLDFVRVFGQYFHIMNRGRVAYAGHRAMLTPDIVSHHLSD